MFGELEDTDSFFSLPSNERVNLTHLPVSTINIIAASPLHSYTCIFRWFNLLVYHLNCGKFKWSTTSPTIKQSMIFVRTLVQERTGLKVDQPDAQEERHLLEVLLEELFRTNVNYRMLFISSRGDLQRTTCKLHTQLSAILRIFNSDRRINTIELGNLCRDTYLLILDSFPWANISPTLHKVLAHSEELLIEMNAGHGFKCFSEEGSEACNKLIRRYREHLARKTSFEDNIIDVFVRLASESDPVLVKSRSK